MKEAERIEKTWNISQRVMLRLNFKAYRYFMEPLSGTKHALRNTIVAQPLVKI